MRRATLIGIVLLAVAALLLASACSGPDPVSTPNPAPTPTAAPTLTSEPSYETTTPPPPTTSPTSIPAPTPEPTMPPAPSPVPTPEPEPTPEPTEEPTAIPEPTEEPTVAPEPTEEPADAPEAAFTRFNLQRQNLGLNPFAFAVEGDDSFTFVQEFVVGCEASVEEYEELLREDIHAISLSLSSEGSECGLKVVTYRAALTEEPTEEPTATPDPTTAPEEAFKRFNLERRSLGLDPFVLAVEGDDSFIPVQELLVGCYASLEEYPELSGEDLDGIALSLSDQGSECGLRVVTYHIVPLAERMRVESSIWNCFSESTDIRAPNDISCAGRFTFLGRHVRWLPQQVLYYIEEGDNHRDDFRSYIPWIEEKLKVHVSQAQSSQDANLILHLGVQSPPNCPERYGCNVYTEIEDRRFSTIYISAPPQFFRQVLKHEILHALLPMGHLPQGNFLMSVRPPDPSQTHSLTPHELKLLELYVHPYLREDMTMDQFRRYLVILDP